MIHVNIETNKGNLLHVKFERAFSDIHYADVYAIAKEKYGDGVTILDWALVDAPDYSTRAYFAMIKKCTSSSERWHRGQIWRLDKKMYLEAKVYK